MGSNPISPTKQMWKNKEDYLEYHRRRKYQTIARFKSVNACILCGLPCFPFIKCFRHRLRAAKNNKRYRKKNGNS